MSNVKDTGYLRNIVAYDASDNITLPANLTVSGTIIGYVPTSRTITINGTSLDLSADRSYSITSMIYPAAGIALSTGTAWGTSITDNSANWNTAYGWGNHASGGYLTSLTDTLSSVTGRGNTTTSSVTIGSSTAPVGKLTIDLANTNYTNTGGAGAHLLMNNTSTTGQTVVSSIINGSVVAKWRTDYVGNISWVAGGSGSHDFYTGGDFGTGTTKLSIKNNGNIQMGTASLNGSFTDNGYRLEVLGTMRVTGQLTLSSTITNGTYTYTLPGATGTLALTSQLNSGTVTGVTATAPVVSSGGTAPVISMAAASSGVNGYMTGAYATKLDGIATGATANTGTVTSVGTSGTVSGLTITGTVTTSGNIVLGGTLSLTSGNVTSGLGYTPVNKAGDTMTGNLTVQGSLLKYIISPAGYAASYNSVFGARASAAGIVQLGNNGDNYIVGGNSVAGGYLAFYVNATSDFVTATNGSLALTIAANTNATFAGTIAASNLSGTNTGDQTNISGNAATTSQRNFDGSLTSPDFYASGWFRNSTALNGLYNSAYDTHFYASGTGQWNFATSNNSWIQIALRPANHQSTVRGYLYADTSNNVGLLTYDGNWGLRVDVSKNVQIYGSVSATNLSGTNTGDQTNISGNAATSNSTYAINYNSLGTATMNVSYGSSQVLRNENGSGGNLSYAPVLHLAASDTMWQIQGDYYNSSDLRWRAGYAGTWYSWRQILHSANYGGYATFSTAISSTSSITAGTDLYLGGSSSGQVRMSTYNTRNLQVIGTAGTDVGILGTINGVSTFGFQLYGASSGEYGFLTGAWAAWAIRMTTAGALFASSDITAYSSDRRLKENITNIPNSLEKVKSLNGVTFDWNDRAIDAGFIPSLRYNDSGLIAQEVQAVLPQAVKFAPFDREKDGSSRSGQDYLTVQYEKIVPLLVEAIKEQQSQIEDLKNKLDEFIIKG